MERLKFEIERNTKQNLPYLMVDTNPMDETGKPFMVNKSRTRKPRLTEGSVGYRLGQTGVSYAKLFAPYLRDAETVTVEGPYIRTDWQIRNFVAFVSVLVDTRPVEVRGYGLTFTLPWRRREPPS